MPSRQRPCWFVLTVKPRHEKTTAQRLRMRELQDFLPLYRVRRAWSDRTQTLELPLFPGYVFCRFNYQQRLHVLNTPGVRSIVGFGATDVPVEDETVEALQMLVASGRPMGPQSRILVGERVRITQGPLEGVRGTLVREGTAWRVVVNVELLHRSVAVEVDRDHISQSAGD
jgi:transcription termination/antitermination protein NusG